MIYKIISAEEAASMINNDEIIGVSGFTPAGDPKLIPLSIAKKAEKLHTEGKEFKITLYAGASTGDNCDGALSRANALKKRMPYQSHNDSRLSINSGNIEFIDMHLSQMAQCIRYGFLEKVQTAIIEAVDVTDDGKIYLTTAGGNSATFCQMADRIFIELNKTCPEGLKEMHDIYVPANPPNRLPIPLYKTLDKIGLPYIKVDPKKINGVIISETPNGSPLLRDPGSDEEAIAINVMEFLAHERKMGRLPNGLPYQSGVGNVANAVLACFASYPGLEPINLFTEVLQDSIFKLADAERLNSASTCSLTFSSQGIQRLSDYINYFKKRIVIRQQEISNNPELVRRLGVIAMNTALEMDIFGNVNSTNVLGSKMMNGIGGSGDFCRNAYISFFMTQSIAKNGDISAIVPLVSHCDHTEHDVQVVVTEIGLADLRGKSPKEKAREIIKNCVHNDYKPLLTDFLEYSLKHAPSKHIPLVLDKAFDFHKRFIQSGSMKLS